MTGLSAIAVLVPVKSFDAGKTRLSSALSRGERRDLAESLAVKVIEACASLPTFVVCEDDDVAEWAVHAGAEVIRPPYSGLNRVVRYGVSYLSEAGFPRVMVIHADLADPTNVSSLADTDGIVLVPDSAMDGTNVLVVPTRTGFRFSYGPNSFARHLSEAERTGLDIRIVVDEPGLSLDLDDPADLDVYYSRQPQVKNR